MYREKLRLTTLLERKIKGDLIEIFKRINGISKDGRHFFLYFSLNWKFIVKTDFKN